MDIHDDLLLDKLMTELSQMSTRLPIVLLHKKVLELEERIQTLEEMLKRV